MTWVTNSSEAARKLRAIDRAYAAARDAAANLPLAQKIEAYRKAKTDRENAYRALD